MKVITKASQHQRCIARLSQESDRQYRNGDDGMQIWAVGDRSFRRHPVGLLEQKFRCL
jgi:hypothetical protein